MSIKRLVNENYIFTLKIFDVSICSLLTYSLVMTPRVKLSISLWRRGQGGATVTQVNEIPQLSLAKNVQNTYGARSLACCSSGN